jgi:hypothetical protein
MISGVAQIVVNTTANQKTAVAAGTVYTVTNSAALLHLGTTDPTITLDLAGTYLIHYRVRYEDVGATFAASRVLTTKLVKTNGTPADVANSAIVFNTPIVTTVTNTLALVSGSVIYTATAGDVISIYGGLDTVASAGSTTVNEAVINAVRLQQ